MPRPASPHRDRMTTRIDPIADGIHRISTFVAEGPPGGITFNQFVVLGDEPLLVHTGMRGMFPAVRDAVASVLDPAELRWISSCHASRPDEYGSLDLWEALAPGAAPADGFTGCFLCLDDLSSRPPRTLADGEVLDLGGRRVRWIDTPHVPGPWEAGCPLRGGDRDALLRRPVRTDRSGRGHHRRRHRRCRHRPRPVRARPRGHGEHGADAATAGRARTTTARAHARSGVRRRLRRGSRRARRLLRRRAARGDRGTGLTRHRARRRLHPGESDDLVEVGAQAAEACRAEHLRQVSVGLTGSVDHGALEGAAPSG